MIRHVLILLRLRLRLHLAAFSAKPGRRAVAVLGLVGIALAAIAFGTSSYYVVRGIDVEEPRALAEAQLGILRLVFLSTFLLQVMTGVAFLSVTDFFDTTRLLHLPVRARSVFVALLLSSILSPATLLFSAPAIGAVAALESSVASFSARAMTVFLLLAFGQACALAIGHALLLALSRRRLRDLATILGSILGIGSYLLLRLVGEHKMARSWAMSGPWWKALAWSPTSFFADPIFLDAGWRLALPATALGAALFAGAAVFARFYDRAGETGQSAETMKNALGHVPFLPAPVAAVAQQTVAIVWREPQLKAMLFQQMVFMLVPMLTFGGRQNSDRVIAWVVPLFIVFSHAWMALGLFGIDGQGIPSLVQSPAPRRQILLGRILGAFKLVLTIDVVAIAAIVVVMTLWMGIRDPFANFFQMLVYCTVGDGLMVGIGAFVSVLAPHPIVRRNRAQRMRQEGCATHAGRAFVALPALAAAGILGSAATLPALLRLNPVWYVVTVPGALALVALISALCIDRGARRLLAREERFVAALVDSGE